MANYGRVAPPKWGHLLQPTTNLRSHECLEVPAQEDVDEQHDGKEDSEGNGKIGEPGRVDGVCPDNAADKLSARTARFSNEDRCGCGHCVSRITPVEGINILDAKFCVGSLQHRLGLQVTRGSQARALADLDITLEVSSVRLRHTEN